MLEVVQYLLLEPLHGIVFGDPMGETNPAFLLSAMRDSKARAPKDNVEVHAINANARVVLDAQVDMLLDTKTKVTRCREVFFSQLVLFYLWA